MRGERTLPKGYKMKFISKLFLLVSTSFLMLGTALADQSNCTEANKCAVSVGQITLNVNNTTSEALGCKKRETCPANRIPPGFYIPMQMNAGDIFYMSPESSSAEFYVFFDATSPDAGKGYLYSGAAGLNVVLTYDGKGSATATVSQD